MRIIWLFIILVVGLLGCASPISVSSPEKDSTGPISSDALIRNCGGSSPKVLNIDDLVVDFTLKDIRGIEYTLSQLLKEKPVILVFGSYT
jgi:cytochrome oxidase Cu insertion factor (SCO1/SenC/PrrC family)